MRRWRIYTAYGSFPAGLDKAFMPHPADHRFGVTSVVPCKRGRFSSIASVAVFHVTMHDSARQDPDIFGIQPFPV